MADDKEFNIDENALTAEATNEANSKIAADTAKKKQNVENSIKKVLDEVGVDADFQEKDDKLVVEIPIGSEVDKDALVSKLLSEKMENARKEAEIEAEKKAQEEIAKRQKELEEEALRKAEEKIRLEAEEKARKLAEEKRLAEEKAAAEQKAAEEKAAAQKKAEEEKAAAAAATAKKAAELKAEKLKARQEEEKKAQEQKDAEEKVKAEKEEKRKIANAAREKKVKEMVEKAKANKVSKPVAKTDPNKFMPNFKRHYLDNVREKLQKEFNYSSSMEIPRMTKITVSLGCSEDKDNKKYLDAAVKELEQITGQHVVRTKAHKSIANFKIRQGQEIGAMVTLRNDNMWYFLERLISVALPRVRDFRGVKPNAFDGHGNYSLGITEQIIFPEIDFDKIEKVSGFNIAFVTTAKNDKEGYALLKELGMPFSK